MQNGILVRKDKYYDQLVADVAGGLLPVREGQYYGQLFANGLEIVPSRYYGQLVAPYRAKAVTFDGTNDFMPRGADLTGAADSSTGMAAFWFKMNGGDDALQRFFANNVGGTSMRIILSRAAANTVNLFLANAGATITYLLPSATTYLADGVWHHAAFSWDMNFSAGNKVGQCYIDDADDAGTPTDAGAAFNVDYTGADWSVGAEVNAGNKLNADIADLALWIGERLDISVEANRRKLISVAGKPVPLGVDGSLPTGTPPIVFQHGPAASFDINRGTGGDFTVTGTLADAATSPSD